MYYDRFCCTIPVFSTGAAAGRYRPGVIPVGREVSSDMNKNEWSPASWQSRPVEQAVEYPDPEMLEQTLVQLSHVPPLVTSWEVETLKTQLAEACWGQRFLLQGGDCSERFDDCRPEPIANKLKILLQMSFLLVHGSGMNVIRLGRFAGQYAKPRSSETETVNGRTLLSYRGDLINRKEFSPAARRPDPVNLLRGYERSAMTLNFIRSLVQGGFADLHHPEQWNLDFVEKAEQAEEYRKTIDALGDAIGFLETIAQRPLNELTRVDFFTSHEALCLPYEQAQTRHVPRRTGWYDLSAHFPWIGNRTRAADGAHVEFCRGIANPLGVKIGPEAAPDEVVELSRVLNPRNEPGRLTIIHRFGADGIAAGLPPLVDAIRKNDRVVLWCCDPMHGNTVRTGDGIKTRSFEDILDELERAFAIHRNMGSLLGGVHFELTGDDVTECTGGSGGLTEKDLSIAYESDVDPRLNYEQAFEMALRIARLMRDGR